MKKKDNEQGNDLQTRQALMAAGIQLIGEKGYDGASIGDIAAFTKVTKWAVYYHFVSKENFALEIIRQCAEKNIEQFKKFTKEKCFTQSMD